MVCKMPWVELFHQIHVVRVEDQRGNYTGLTVQIANIIDIQCNHLPFVWKKQQSPLLSQIYLHFQYL